MTDGCTSLTNCLVAGLALLVVTGATAAPIPKLAHHVPPLVHTQQERNESMKEHLTYNCIVAAVAVAALALASGWTLIGLVNAGEPTAGKETFSKVVTFRTAQNAPENFAGFTFFWTYPMVEPDARLAYVVFKPDGTEYFRYPKLSGSGGELCRSDFRLGFPAGDVNDFFGKPIAISFTVTQGDIVFDPDGPQELGYHFAFYTNGPNGKINWKAPFTTVPAVKESK
jgi:hypothetical protein